ncbi:hypothetical protein RCH20_000226 [Psychrobacter sp. PL15]|nr:hypothetical protein [Psychrobacter sp. PL15]
MVYWNDVGGWITNKFEITPIIGYPCRVLMLHRFNIVVALFIK